LFACNVASGAPGRRFIADLSHLAGDITVDAATHPVGSAELGGSWTLDASTGTAPNPAGVPFTERALAQFHGVLAAAFYKVAATNPFPILSSGTRILAGDFNNDGNLDILFQSGSTTGQGVLVALGNGDGTFQFPFAEPNNAAFGIGPLTGIAFSSVIAGST